MTKYSDSDILIPIEMPDDPVTAIQRFYSLIYLACHRHHVRAASTPYRLSAQDSILLAHLDEKKPMLTGKLAKHLGVAASTLSASVKRLEFHGYLIRTPRLRARRQGDLHLTTQGTRAMSASSVLDSSLLGKLLHQLTPAEGKRAVAGLALLGRAARVTRIRPRPNLRRTP